MRQHHGYIVDSDLPVANADEDSSQPGTSGSNKATALARVSLGAAPAPHGAATPPHRMSLPGGPADHLHYGSSDANLTGVAKDLAAVRSIVMGSWINLLLLAVPLAFASGVYEWGAVPTFTLNFVALIPLALILGDVTEDLALRYAGGKGCTWHPD